MPKCTGCPYATGSGAVGCATCPGLQTARAQRTATPQGWVCPTCGSVYSPYVQKCTNCPRVGNAVSTTEV